MRKPGTFAHQRRPRLRLIRQLRIAPRSFLFFDKPFNCPVDGVAAFQHHHVPGRSHVHVLRAGNGSRHFFEVLFLKNPVAVSANDQGRRREATEQTPAVSLRQRIVVPGFQNVRRRAQPLPGERRDEAERRGKR